MEKLSKTVDKLMTKFRTRYSPRVAHQTPVSGKSLTKQSFKAECDVNNIVRRYQQTGVVTHVNRGQPKFGDFSNLGTYHEALLQVTHAQQAFMDLPAVVRDRFGNDPGALLEFLDDPANDREAIRLGLKTPPSVGSQGSKTGANPVKESTTPEAPKTEMAPKKGDRGEPL